MRPITPQYESNESLHTKMLGVREKQRKRRMVIDFRAVNDSAFINQRTRSAGGWIDGNEPFDDPRIRKDDPRKEVRFDEDRVEVDKHESRRNGEHNCVLRALTNSVGRICNHHGMYCGSHGVTMRLVLVMIFLFCAELGLWSICLYSTSTALRSHAFEDGRHHVLRKWGAHGD